MVRLQQIQKQSIVIHLWWSTGDTAVMTHTMGLQWRRHSVLHFSWHESMEGTQETSRLHGELQCGELRVARWEGVVRPGEPMCPRSAARGPTTLMGQNGLEMWEWGGLRFHYAGNRDSLYDVKKGGEIQSWVWGQSSLLTTKETRRKWGCTQSTLRVCVDPCPLSHCGESRSREGELHGPKPWFSGGDEHEGLGLLLK